MIAVGRAVSRNGRQAESRSRARVAFVIEQALGHVTHGRNLANAVAGRDEIDGVWLDVPPAGAQPSRLPVVRSYWALQASLEARRALTSVNASSLDALFMHTQSVTLLAEKFMRRVPTVISLDATPLNFDEVGAAYGQRLGSRGVERFKLMVYRHVFRAAAAFTTWSEWAKRSLANDYGVDPARVRVFHPGADHSLFTFGRMPRSAATDRPLRLLFVGGDLRRKGGDMLISLVAGPLAGRCELDVVTGACVEPVPGVRVHPNVAPNSPELLGLYREADLFVLPTRADCLAVVLGEAMAAALPIITTTVGAHREAVLDGESGWLLPPGDVVALQRKIEFFLENPGAAVEMGQRARVFGEERFDSRRNADAIADMILGVAHERGPRRTGEVAA